MSQVTVIGGGSWGSAIANILASKGVTTCLYVRDNNHFKQLIATKRNPNYLKDFVFDSRLRFSNIFSESVKEAEIIVLAVPTNSCRQVFSEISKYDIKNKIIVNLAKGLEENTHKRISEIAKEVLGTNNYAVLSGPSHAEEVAMGIPTTVVVCSDNTLITEKIQELFFTENFRVYGQNDLVGVEIGGALKNIIALAAGLNDGLGFGDNTKAALMTRGLYEIQKLGVSLGAKYETFFGLAGIGDLIVTCTSRHSRNWNFGYLIGKGYTSEDAIKEVKMVVEGYKTTKSAYELACIQNIEMPITEKLYEVLYKDADPRTSVIDLMNRKSKNETIDFKQKC